MKNNLRRTFIRASTYLVILMLPLVMILFASITEAITTKEVRIGVLGDEAERKHWEDIFSEDETIEIALAKPETMHTDQIIGKYDQIINKVTEKEKEESIKSKILEERTQNTDVTKNSMSQSQRMIAMLVTIYMVIATIYVSREVRDEQEGVKRRYAYAGGRHESYMLGYIGSTFVTILLQVEAILISLYLFQSQYMVSLGRTALIGVIISVVVSCFAAVIVGITRKELSANITASAIAALSSILGGTFVAISQMPDILRVLSVISPIRWIVSLL